MLQLNVPISMSGAGCYFKKDPFQSKNLILKSVVMGEQFYLILVVFVGTLQGQVLFWLLVKCQLLSTVTEAVLRTCTSLSLQQGYFYSILPFEMFIEVWDCRHLGVSFRCAAVMFATITLLKFWMYKNEVEKKGKKIKSLVWLVGCCFFFSVFVCLFVCLSDCEFFPNSNHNSCCGWVHSKDVQAHSGKQNLTEPQQGFPFNSGWSEPCRKRKSWLLSAQGPCPHSSRGSRNALATKCVWSADLTAGWLGKGMCANRERGKTGKWFCGWDALLGTAEKIEAGCECTEPRRESQGNRYCLICRGRQV